MKSTTIPDDLQKLADLCSPKKFRLWLSEKEEASLKEPYCEAVYKQCHSATGWMLVQLKDTEYWHHLEVCHGLWKDKDHSWLKIGDYYFDLTMAQFDETVDDLFVSLEEDYDYNRYSPIDEIPVTDMFRLKEWMMTAGSH